MSPEEGNGPLPAPRFRALFYSGGLAVLFASAYLLASLRLDPLLTHPRTANVWFDSDAPYRFETMAHPKGGMHHGGAHPLFPSIARMLMMGSHALTAGSAEPLLDARVGLALAGGLWVGLLFFLFQRMRLAPLDATLFAAAGGVSAGALFWFTVPETFALAGVGVTLALFVAAAARPSNLALVLACVASASCILTNAVVGGVAVLAHVWSGRQWKRALGIIAAAFAVVSATWITQEWGRGSPFFLSRQLFEYRQHTFAVTLSRTARVVPALLSHSMVAPGLRNDRPKFRRMPPGSSGPLGVGATGVWGAVLILGAIQMTRAARRRETRPLVVTTGASLAVMLAMHLTLGREMFLYAMDVLPLLLVVAAAAAWPERGRRFVRLLVCSLIVLGAANNVRQFLRAADAANALAVQRVESGRRSMPGS